MTKLLPTSLQRPQFKPEAAEVYRDAILALMEEGVPYLVGGAVAMNAHTGVWRDTKDLDVFVREESLSKALRTLEAAGFEVEITDPLWLAKAKRGDYFVDIIHRNANGTGDVESDWFENAKPSELFGIPLQVTPAEESLLSKMFVAFRNRWDASDILHIIFASGGDLDWDRMIRKAGDHWQLLLSYLTLYSYAYPSHAHYVPRRVWHRLLGRMETEIADATGVRDAPFRGTMLDCVSFQVDINEWGLGPDARAAERNKRSDEADLLDREVKRLIEEEKRVAAREAEVC